MQNHEFGEHSAFSDKPVLWRVCACIYIYILYLYAIYYICIYILYLYKYTQLTHIPSAEFEQHKSPTSPVALPSCSCFDGVAHLHG